MKRLSTLTLLLLCTMLMSTQSSFAGKTKTFDEPVCLGTTTQTISITKVEFTDTATIVSFHEKYKPGWWIKIAKDSYLLGDKGRKYKAIKGDGITLGENYVTPESGEGDFKVLFEPMPKKTSHFDFIEPNVKGPFIIMGVHDKSKPVKVKTPKKDFVMTEELEKEFFKVDTVRVRGRIDGYSPELGFKTMNFIRRNAMTQEDSPMTVKVDEDGSFEFSYLGYHPKNEMMIIQTDKMYAAIGFYVIPGQTTEFVTNLEGLVTYTKMPEGAFARNNSLLNDFKELCDYSYAEYSEDSKGLTTLTDFAEVSMKKMADRLTLADYISERFGYTQWERHLARCNTMVQFGYFTLDFESNISYGLYGRGLSSEEWDKAIAPLIDSKAYSFMRQLPCNSPTPLVFDQTYFLLNRYAFTEIMRNPLRKIMLGKLDEAVEDTLIAMVDKRIMGDSKPSFFAKMLILTEMERNLQDKARESEEALKEYYNSRYSQLRHYALQTQAKRVYDEAVEKSKIISPLPISENSIAFLKILNKYKGKYVMVDFWGMGCAPCRAGIRNSLEMRKALRDNPDIEFVFINASGESTPEAYKEFVDEYLEGEEIYEVSRDEYNRFMELFKFTGIPHYETFDREGNIINDGFRYNTTADDFIRFCLDPIKEKLDK